jgi:predicted peroxiredoxin
MATEQQQSYLVISTHFDREPDLAAVSLVVANNALAAGSDVLIWLTSDAVELAKKGEARRVQPPSFSNLGELLDKYIGAGGRIGVCPPCAKTHGVTDDNLIANAAWMGAPALLSEMQSRRTLSF